MSVFWGHSVFYFIVNWGTTLASDLYHGIGNKSCRESVENCMLLTVCAVTSENMTSTGKE